jgi:hypothetical protein
MSLSQPASSPPPRPCPPTPCPPTPQSFPKFDTVVQAYRDRGKIGPPPGRRPPNWFGWNFVNAPYSTLVNQGSSALVVADGQNVVISGGGFATITQAYSV